MPYYLLKGPYEAAENLLEKSCPFHLHCLKKMINQIVEFVGSIKQKLAQLFETTFESRLFPIFTAYYVAIWAVLCVLNELAHVFTPDSFGYHQWIAVSASLFLWFH